MEFETDEFPVIRKEFSLCDIKTAVLNLDRVRIKISDEKLSS